MTIWALADLHLSFGVPDKKMDVFGEKWKDHPQKIKEHWCDLVAAQDLVLIPGDISWAMKLHEAEADLEWIAALPGTKVMIRGNHDYWWSAISRVRGALPPGMHAIQNDSFQWKDFEIGGARLWDAEFSYSEFIPLMENPRADPVLYEVHHDEEERVKIFSRELARLEASLRSFKRAGSFKIAMTHYPPVDAAMNASPVSDLLEQYGVSVCAFGH
ncbi:MAG: metallophosphoesterase, partial [Chlamydiia bacterium]|nr:metallophosphoesterase [Chlamydiia bacterium]